MSTRIKRGTVRADGKIFYRYCHGGELWVTPARLAEIKLSEQVINRRYYQNNRKKICVRVSRYNAKHQEKKAKYLREYYRRNWDKAKVARQKYYALHKEHLRKKQRLWYRSNFARIRVAQLKRRKERSRTDLNYRMRLNLRARVSIALRTNSAQRWGTTLGLLGCTIPQLREHLARLFKPGMTWENYGYTGWHIDHVRPCASFDLRKPSQQRACFHYTNLQPLWAQENFKKRAKYVSLGGLK